MEFTEKQNQAVSLIPMEAEEMLCDVVQMQARLHLQQRVAAGELSATHWNALQELHEAGDIRATYDPNLRNYLWTPTAQGRGRSC
jgi:hypothetical protein